MKAAADAGRFASEVSLSRALRGERALLVEMPEQLITHKYAAHSMFRLDRIQSVVLPQSSITSSNTSLPIAPGASFSALTSKLRERMPAGGSIGAGGHTPPGESLDQMMRLKHQTIHAPIGESPYRNQPVKFTGAQAITRNEPHALQVGAAGALAKGSNGRASLSCAGIKTMRSELQVGLLQSAKALCTPNAAALSALHARQRPRHYDGRR